MLARILGRKPSTPAPDQGLRLVEGVSGNWHYHLAYGPGLTALCDPSVRVMATAAPLDSWGFRPGHIPHSYCRACEQVAMERHLGLPPTAG